MRIRLSDRAKECNDRMIELVDELNDYNSIAMCAKALQAVATYPDKFEYSQDDYDKVITKFYNLCAKHEIKLPDDEFIEWSTIDIV